MILKLRPTKIIFPILCLFVALLSWQLLQAQEAPLPTADEQAVSEWSPPGTVLSSGGVSGGSPEISYSPVDNEVIVLFHGWTGSNDQFRDPYFARSSDNGASWGSQTAISAGSGVATFSTASVIHDHEGNTHVVALAFDNSTYTVTHSIKTVGTANSWATTNNIDEATSLVGGFGANQAVIIESSDDVIDIVWEGMIDPSGDPDATLYHRRSVDGGTSWGAKGNVIASPNAAVQEVSIAADSSGRVHLVWEQSPTPGTNDIYYARYNGSWSAPVLLSSSSLVSGDSFLPTIEVTNNAVHVAFMERDSQSDPQSIYYRTCGIASQTCESESHWSSLQNISSQQFVVNNAPVDITPELSYDATNEVMHVFFYGIRSGSGSTNEVLWQNTDCNSWVELDSITTGSAQTIYPNVRVESGVIHLAYEDFTNNSIYYMQDSYTCTVGLIAYLPLITR